MDCEKQGGKAGGPRQAVQASFLLNWQHHLEAVALALALHLHEQHLPE